MMEMAGYFATTLFQPAGVFRGLPPFLAFFLAASVFTPDFACPPLRPKAAAAACNRAFSTVRQPSETNVSPCHIE